jgi:hypothetical protein
MSQSFLNSGTLIVISPLSFVAVFIIRDPGWGKIRIRDNHLGSATLLFCIQYYIIVTPLGTSGLIHDWR